MAIKLGNQNNFNMQDHLFEDYAGLVTGAAFPRHAAIKFEGTFDDLHLFIVNAAQKNEKIEEVTRSNIKCATLMGIGDVYVSAQLVSKAGRPNEVVPISVAKYLVIFADGRQAVITSRLAESQLNLERFLF